MKKIISKLILCGAVFALASCNLERLPETETAQDAFYTDDTEVEYGLIGAYNALQEIWNYAWLFSEIRSDNARATGLTSSDGTGASAARINFFLETTTETVITDYWQNLYIAINRCNLVIDNIDNVEDEDNYKQFLAEAKFLRAMLYFDLARLFGDIWYVTDSGLTGEEALLMSTITPEEVYELVATELEEAIDLGGLPIPSAQSSDEIGRATDYAARALLARVYLTQNDYSSVKSTLSPIIADYGIDNLVPYADIFDIYNEMNEEILFAVRYVGGGYGLGSMFQNWFGPSNYGDDYEIAGNSSGYMTPTDDLLRAYGNEYVWVDLTDNVETVIDYDRWFVEEDRILGPDYVDYLSIEWAIDRTGDVRSAVSYDFRYTKGGGWWCCKYYTRGTTTTVNDGYEDWPVIRYADVILMYAEALNSGDDDQTEAVKYINPIRKRAGLAGLVAADYDQASLHEALLDERRLEFAGENVRWFDLRRESAEYVEDLFIWQFNYIESYYQYYDNDGPNLYSLPESKFDLVKPFALTSLYD